MKPEVEQSSSWFVFAARLVPVFSHCFDQEESLTDHGSPVPPRPPSCCFSGIIVFCQSLVRISARKHTSNIESRRHCWSRLLFHMAPQATSSSSSSWAQTEILALLCFSDPFLTVFIFHNDANKLKGSKCTLRQISLALRYRQTSLQQPSKEAMKFKCTLILNSFS